MTDARWHQVKALFQATVERPPSERAAFLAAAVGDDEALRREVESLLRSDSPEVGFTNRLPVREPSSLPSLTDSLALSSSQAAFAGSLLGAGTRIGSYEVLGLLGAGAMGEVYRARDTRLNRDVALKVLPELFALDADRLARFKREAQMLASLNHPNIAAIYGVEESNPAAGSGQAIQALVLELADGPTLADRVGRGPMPVGDALTAARQIADALEAAHERGIIHRDLKPANIKITGTGAVKVLDFGLAKVWEGAPQAEAGGSPTLTVTELGECTILGTPAYMSPEQARGQVVDKRTDIWAFGCVLYQMLAGRMAFPGATVSDTIVAILEREPDWSALPRATPASIRRLLRRCLEKDSKRRLHDIADARIEIDDAVSSGESDRTLPGTLPQRRERRWRWTAIASFAAFIAAAAILVWRPNAPGPAARRPVFTQLTIQPGPELYPSLSPDGQSFVYAAKSSGNWDIYLQRVGGQKPFSLTEDSSADDVQPAFSPDGRRIAFRSERDGGGIFVMGGTGESVQQLTSAGFNPAWSPDGKEIVYSTVRFVRPDVRLGSSQLFAVNVTTGASRLLSANIEDAMQPHWSPHGRRIAYWSRRETGTRDIWTIPAAGGSPVAVTSDSYLDWNPVWSPDGESLYFSSDRGGSMNLWRVAIDERSGKVLSPPEPITTPSPSSGFISVSRNGKRIAYAQQVRTVNVTRITFDPARETTVGQPLQITQGLNDTTAPKLSPDGKSIVFYTFGKQETLYVVGSDGTGLRQLTENEYRHRGPSWSPDGRHIGVFSNRSGRDEIWMMNRDGTALQQLTGFGCELGPRWSPDGTRFACHTLLERIPVIVEVGSPSKKTALAQLPGEDRFRVNDWSPDGRRLAGNMNASGGSTGIVLYSLDSREYQRVTTFGWNPRWLSDSRRLLFQHQGKLYLCDTASKNVHEILSVAPYEVEDYFTVSKDDRMIVFGLVVTEADIWMMELR